MAEAPVLAGLCADLSAEYAGLDALVAELDEAGWHTPTPAEGWTVRDQISHLASVEEWASTAAGDPEAFVAWRATLPPDGEGVVDGAVEQARAKTGVEVLAWWRKARALFLEQVGRLEPASRVPWLGPPMSPASLVTARLMETWAHGEDVADALGVVRPPTARLRHVAHLGVRTRAHSYASRGLPAPTGEVRVELDGPGGERWAWGDESAPDRISGPVLDFCLVVTRRRRPADTALVAEGPLAREWLSIAQAFVGPAGPDPPSRE